MCTCNDAPTLHTSPPLEFTSAHRSHLSVLESRRNLTRCFEHGKRKRPSLGVRHCSLAVSGATCKYRRPELASFSGAAYDSLDCRTDQGHSCSQSSSTWFPLQPQAGVVLSLVWPTVSFFPFCRHSLHWPATFSLEDSPPLPRPPTVVHPSPDPLSVSLQRPPAYSALRASLASCHAAAFRSRIPCLCPSDQTPLRRGETSDMSFGRTHPRDAAAPRTWRTRDRTRTRRARTERTRSPPVRCPRLARRFPWTATL